MRTLEIPNEIKQAAVGMLSSFIPDLTPDTLEARLMSPSHTAEKQAEKLLSRRESASALSISTVTLDRMLAAGELPKVTVRGRVFARRSDIDAIISGKEISA
jgi:predicted DNA-binding transcriptional regulator AlpA